MKCIHITVSGRVQGVFFRDNVQKRAIALSIAGEVRNVDRDKVDIIAQGEEEDLEKLIAYCQRGPLLAEVHDVLVEDMKVKKELKSFEVK